MADKATIACEVAPCFRRERFQFAFPFGIIGCDLHARQQTLAMLDMMTGEVTCRTLLHEGNEVREFYSQLLHPVLVGIEAIGSMQWFLKLLEELGIECQIGDATLRVSTQ